MEIYKLRHIDYLLRQSRKKKSYIAGEDELENQWFFSLTDHQNHLENFEK